MPRKQIEQSALTPENEALGRAMSHADKIADRALRRKLQTELETIGQYQMRRLSKKSSDNRRRILVGAMVPREAAARYKRLASIVGEPITTFAAAAFETRYEMLLEALTSQRGAHERE